MELTHLFTMIMRVMMLLFVFMMLMPMVCSTFLYFKRFVQHTNIVSIRMIFHRKLSINQQETHLMTMIMSMWIIITSMLQFDSQLFQLISHSGNVGSDDDLILDREAGEYCLDVFWE